MPSVEELAAALRAAMAIVTEARSQLDVARARNEEALAGFQQVTAGSGDARSAASVAHLHRALERLPTAAGLMYTSNDRVEQYITTVLGVGGGSSFGTGSTAPPPQGAAGDPLSNLPRWGAARPSGVPDKRTHGVWHDGRGQMAEFVSGTSGLYAQMSKAFWTRGIWGGSPPPSDAWTHAEAQFATFMRASGKKHETISINHPEGPCADCNQLISFYLKEGSSLTVRWPGGERTYRGRQEHERDNAALLRELKARKRR